MIESKAMNATTSPASHVTPASRSVFERWGALLTGAGG
jgi:hypothetical protein